MPMRQGKMTLEEFLAELDERVRQLETHTHPDEVGEGGGETDKFRGYSWQSGYYLGVGFGHKLHADRQGSIIFVRAERSTGDGTSEAEFDVLLNGSSIFTTHAKPTVPAGEVLGPKRTPNFKEFNVGDSFQIQVLDTGGGTGPLRVTIHFSDPQ